MATVLLIDDSKFQRTVNEQLLKQAGYDVISAADGEHALASVWERRPDLVLLDMLLPKMGGQEVLQFLKQDPSTAHIPVIVLTSLSQKNARRLLQAGAAAFLEKGPVLQQPELLLSRVSEILSRTQRPDAQFCMRGDLEVCRENRAVTAQEPVYKVEFFPEEQTGMGPSACTVRGETDLQQLLSQFGIEAVYLDGWLKQLGQEDILIPYVGMPESLRGRYGL